MIGGFDWCLIFQWYFVFKQERDRWILRIDFIRLFIMVGGLFVVSKKYFQYFGMYDIGMEVWGGENFELFFRVWQCGGKLEIYLCFYVGYVFFKWVLYVCFNFLQNIVWVVEVWMDEYKEYFYNRNFLVRKEVYGDIFERKLL